MTATLPRIVFFNINGSGLGHLSRCLAYARRMRGRARPVFFSLASAIEIIEEMGFEADYFVSEFWSRSDIGAWNRELAVRFGLFLDEVEPQVVVFDGTWPFHGFMDACDVAQVPVRVWSNRGLHKPDFEPVPVAENLFDLIIAPGEIGSGFSVERGERPGRKVRMPPVTVLETDELLDRNDARDVLGLTRDGRYALFSLGPGNLKDIGPIAEGLIAVFRSAGFHIVWPRAPITTRDLSLPHDVISVDLFPVVKYMKAFDVFAGSAGYNTCCEVLQSGVPSLLVPNELVADDQARRARAMTDYSPVVVSACETPGQRNQALQDLLAIARTGPGPAPPVDGAARAADEILALTVGSAA